MDSILEKKYSRKRIGETYTTKEGYKCKIIDGGSKPGYCTVQIENWTTEIQIGNVERGVLKYPYHLFLAGIGYLGEGIYKPSISKKLTKAYVTWTNMINRCYDFTKLEKHPTYKDVTVCSEWHNFQVFTAWFEENYIEGYHLDKDLLSNNSKVYSSNTCIFIPQALNNFLTNDKNIVSKNLPIGVTMTKDGKNYIVKIRSENKLKHLGQYKNIQIASLQYKLARKKEANKWKEKMQGTLPQKAINNIK